MQADPIIAVKNVEYSSKWYQTIFDCKSIHGGNEFEILVSENDEVLLCLHKWGEHGHPTMEDPNITPGNGLILYFRTENMEQIRENLRMKNYPLEGEIELNPNSGRKEFSVIDPDGYYLTISEFHNYEG